MEMSGTGGAARIQAVRSTFVARNEVQASQAGPGDAGPTSDPPTGPARLTGSLSSQMLDALFRAQEASDGTRSAETEAELAARLAAMLEQALSAEQPSGPGQAARQPP